jgi:methionyl aminopeptidase
MDMRAHTSSGSKSLEDIEGMRVAGRLAAEVLDFITPHVKPGASTGHLDRLCHDYMVNVQGTVPAPLNYAPPGHQPYPKSICTSVNHQVCHGVPGEKILRSGDIVNIDITVIKDGWHGDTSRMFYVGEPTVQARRLCETTYECMWKGIATVRPGATLGDIGAAIQRHAEARGYSVVREFCGHGIGRRFHEEPQILHYGRPGHGLKLVAGMTFTIEPMINAGKRDIRQLADGWTIVTADHSLSAQWEHTVLVTEDGHEVLTLSAATPPAPAFVTPRSERPVEG